MQNLPSTQHPEVFGMHENVDISKDLQQTKLLFDSLILTQGGGSKEGGSSGGDNNLLDIASDILSKVIIRYMWIFYYVTQKLLCNTMHFIEIFSSRLSVKLASRKLQH